MSVRQGTSDPTPRAVYLRNHEAAAHAGHDLFVRVATSQRRRPHGPELQRLADEVGEDLQALQRHLRDTRIRPAVLLTLVMRVGERVARLKPNGQLILRSPLTDLIEVEGLLDAVQAKAAGWQALEAAPITEPSAMPHTAVLDTRALLERVTDQIARLEYIHRSLAAMILSG